MKKVCLLLLLFLIFLSACNNYGSDNIFLVHILR